MTTVEWLLGGVVALLTAMLIIQRFVIERLAKRPVRQVIPTGHFKVRISAKDFEEGATKGVFAISVTDRSNGKVMFTVMVEKEGPQ